VDKNKRSIHREKSTPREDLGKRERMVTKSITAFLKVKKRRLTGAIWANDVAKNSLQG